MRFKTRDYSRVTARDVEADAQAERTYREQELLAEAVLLSDDAVEKAKRWERHDDEWVVYDLIHGGAWYADDDPHKLGKRKDDKS